MNLKNKKVVLKNIILNNEFSYDMTVYRLINTNCLDAIISKIDNLSVVCNVNPNNNISANEQFLRLLNRFVICFKNIFPIINGSSEFVIENIINSNQYMVEKYLLSKHYLGDNAYSDFFYHSIYRLFINNFISNSKYISHIDKLLKKEKIKLKKMADYTFDEIHKIKDLLVRLVFCSPDRYCSLYLFYNIDYEINKYLSSIDNEKNCCEYKIIEYFKVQYDFIIKDYETKKKYLKYFKY